MSSAAETRHPYTLFCQWFELAKQHEPSDVDAASVATVDENGYPSIRIVLIRGMSEEGFSFYTNLGSRKAREIKANPGVALCFHWKSIAKQIRIEGEAQQVSDSDADVYFAGRPRESQIGAWASKQSAVLSGREELEAQFRKLEQDYIDKDVQRPPFWSGFLLRPRAFEFWDKRPYRLHDRQRFSKIGDSWERQLLFP